MKRITNLEQMLIEVELGDKIETNDKYDNTNTGVIEFNGELYNVLFPDGYGDDEWVDESLQDLVNGWYQAWNVDGVGKITLIKEDK